MCMHEGTRGFVKLLKSSIFGHEPMWYFSFLQHKATTRPYIFNKVKQRCSELVFDDILRFILIKKLFLV